MKNNSQSFQWLHTYKMVAFIKSQILRWLLLSLEKVKKKLDLIQLFLKTKFSNFPFLETNFSKIYFKISYFF